jgi:hypothetical protein
VQLRIEWIPTFVSGHDFSRTVLSASSSRRGLKAKLLKHANGTAKAVPRHKACNVKPDFSTWPKSRIQILTKFIQRPVACFLLSKGVQTRVEFNFGFSFLCSFSLSMCKKASRNTLSNVGFIGMSVSQVLAQTAQESDSPQENEVPNRRLRRKELQHEIVATF